MKVMDVSLNFWNTSKWRPKYWENVQNHSAAPWFWALLSKSLEEVLNSLHVLVVLAILKISAPNAENKVKGNWSWHNYFGFTRESPKVIWKLMTLTIGSIDSGSKLKSSDLHVAQFFQASFWFH